MAAAAAMAAGESAGDSMATNGITPSASHTISPVIPNVSECPRL